jgi:hypothetical protein
VLARLVEESGDLAVARRWLELDPLHEPAHRALIRLYSEQGDRAAALAQYRECVRTLSRELGVPPLEETTRLYEAISEGHAGGARRAAGGGGRRRCRARRWSGERASGRRCSAPTTGIAGDGRVVLLEGEAGIGKTRLAEELVAALRARGAAVLGGPRLRGGGGARLRPAGRGAARAPARGRRRGWRRSASARSARRRGCWAI